MKVLIAVLVTFASMSAFAISLECESAIEDLKHYSELKGSARAEIHKRPRYKEKEELFLLYSDDAYEAYEKALKVCR